jgi:LmbE family N-acetylglucosaminyl deacetylase
MKAMALVAHPDDCVIFAYSYMHNHPEYSWTVCYLTYTKLDDRGIEFDKFWNQRGIAVKFLGFDDWWDSIKNCPGAIDPDLARIAVQQAIHDQDLLLTHNSAGEYGHPHHVLVHECAQHHPRRVVFADPGTGTVKYQIGPGIYSLDELPLHKDIVLGFHKENHTNEYTICKNI